MIDEIITEAKKGWTPSARRFIIWGAAVLMLGTLLSIVWAGIQRVEVYISLPERLDRIEVKVNDIDKNVRTLLKRGE